MAAKVQIIFYLQSVKYLFFVKNKLFFEKKNDYLCRKIGQSENEEFLVNDSP